MKEAGFQTEQNTDNLDPATAEALLPFVPDWDAAYAECAKAKRNKYKRIPAKQLTFFNRMSWLSMYYKGMLLIEAFHTQFFPKIETVLAVQKHGFLKDEETGDSITGYIDMILKLKNIERPIIFDLKTAARPYTDDQIEHSEQLTIYLAMEGQRFNTDQVGYVVLSKAINKETEAFCNSCGHKRDGRHKTCNNEVTHTKELSPEDIAAGIIAKSTTGRCTGSWNETVVLKPQVQVLIRGKNDKQIEDVLESQSNIIVGMKNRVVYRNTSKCENWYGNRCPFFDLCHKGSDPKLIIPPKEEENV